MVVSVIMSILVLGIIVFDIDIHALLLIAISFTAIVSMIIGYTFDDLTEGIQKSISDIMPALMIFIMIGVLIASWIVSGTVPIIIYYGFKMISPNLFLPIGLLLCSIISVAIGTSWGTVGTIGIALMGMGSGLGVPSAITAGMIVSGAYFGDKMSPISDTTNLASATIGAALMGELFLSIILNANLYKDEFKKKGYFYCQGKMPMGIRTRYVSMLTANPEDEKLKVSIDNFDAAQSHPDTDDLRNAKTFAEETIKKVMKG